MREDRPYLKVAPGIQPGMKRTKRNIWVSNEYYYWMYLQK